MGFRSAWALVSLSVGLGFIVGCATQSTDSPIGEDGGEPSGATGGTSSAGHGGSSGTSSSSGTGGTLGAAGSSAGGSAGTLSGGSGGAATTGGSSGAAGSLGVSGGGSGGNTSGGGGATGGGGASAGTGGSSSGGGGAGGHGGNATGGGGATGGAGATSSGGGGATGGGATGGGGATSTGGGGSGNSGAGGSSPVGSTSYTLNRFVIGSSAASATVNVSWDGTKIEFVFNVSDATPESDSPLVWNDDAVEIYLDPNNGRTTTYQADDCEIEVPRGAGAVAVVGTVNTAAITVVKSSNATGYTADVTVPWSALNITGSPDGQTIGLNLAVDDDTNGGDRDAQLMLSGDQTAFSNPSAWASLLLN